MTIVIANGKEILGWQTVTVTDSMDQIVDSFRIVTPNERDEAGFYLPIEPLDKVEIRPDVDSDPLLVGWVDTVDFSLTENQSTMTASGRSLASDLVDCSVVVDKYNLRNIDALQIMKRILKPFGIDVSVAAGVDIGEPFEKFAMQVGESCFEAINRALQARSVLPATIPSTGGLELVNAGSIKAVDSLVAGVNCKAVSGRFSVMDRYSEYKILGQTTPVRKLKNSILIGSIGAKPGSVTTIKNRNPRKTNRIVGIANDSEIERFRPKIIKAKKRTSTKEATAKARWEASYRFGKSSNVRVQLPSWYQSNGEPWRSNMLVKVTVPEGNLYDYEMIVRRKSASYSTTGGETVSLDLVHPDTFTPPPQKDVKKGRKGSAWNKGTLIASVGRLKPGEIIKKGKQ